MNSNNPENYEFNPFSFDKLVLNKLGKRELNFLIKEKEEEVDRLCKLLFRYDTATLEMGIANIEEEKLRTMSEMESHMFINTEIEKDLNDRIEAAKRELKDGIKNNPDLAFDGTMKKIEFKATGTYIAVEIADEVAIRINEIKKDFGLYQVVLLDNKIEFHDN